MSLSDYRPLPPLKLTDAMFWLKLYSNAEMGALLGISKQGVAAWGGYIPETRVAQLMVLRPAMFGLVMRPMTAAERAECKPLGYSPREQA